MNTLPLDAAVWAEAQQAAAVLALQPHALGGVVLRAAAGPVRDAWLERLRSCLPHAAALRRMPFNVPDERLIGGLDLGSSLATGHAVAQRGLLAEADGGLLLLAMAERTSAATAARLAAVLDSGELTIAREGVTQTHRSRIAVVALDEGAGDERPPTALTDRLAIWLDLASISARAVTAGDLPLPDAGALTRAREHLGAVRIDEDFWSVLCAAALAMGIVSMRAPLLAARVARALAALDGRDAVDTDDTALAARWVLGPRATVAPLMQADAPPDVPHDAAQEQDRRQDQEPASEAGPRNDDGADELAHRAEPLEETVLAAARATMPAHLLERFALQGADRAPPTAASGAGQARAALRRGTPTGVRPGDPRGGQRLNLLATLRAAAPWQRLRGASTVSPTEATGARIRVRAEDFRITRFRQRAQTTVIFVVDASGSAALHRLAEAKGAVELLLADCYARRDSVAVLAFRGPGAELLLPPTRSLVRAKRALAGLPGGGGTPLASAIDAAAALAHQVQRGGNTPLTVLLTDGRANIARDGSPGRERAEAQALHAARRLRAGRLAALLLDTSPRPQAPARQLAVQMGALYLALPHADASGLCHAVRAAKRAPELSGSH